MAWSEKRTRKNKWGQTEYYENLGGLSDGRWSTQKPYGWTPGYYDTQEQETPKPNREPKKTDETPLFAAVIMLFMLAAIVAIVVFIFSKVFIQ